MQKFDTQAFAAAGKNAAADLTALATTAFAGFEKLAELNMATAKSVLENSLGSIQAVASATTPEDVLAAQTKMAQPMAEKAAAYGRSVYDIASQTGAELSKVSKDKLADAQKTWGSAVESMTQNVPAGSEAFVSAFKNAATTGQQAFAQAQAAAQQAMAQAQNHVTDVVAKTVKTAKTAAKV